MGKVFKFLTFTVFLSLFLFSCEVGVGEAIDLDGPEVKILKPNANFSYQPRSIVLEGTAADNKEVTSVEISWSYVDDQGERHASETPITAEKFPKGENTDGKNEVEWKATTDPFPADAEIKFEVTAFDAMKNAGKNRTEYITVIVDTSAPDETGISITRNDTYVVNLASKERLSERIENASKRSSRDFLQNEVFTIKAQLSDNYSIKESNLSIYTDRGGVESCVLRAKKIDETATNKFAPSWTVTAEDLKDAPLDENGACVLYPVIWAVDEAGNELELNEALASDDADLDKGFVWLPSSDKPKVLFPLYSTEEDCINASKNMNIPFSAFDDDGISSIEYALIPEDDWAGDKTGISCGENNERAFDAIKSKVTFQKKDFNGETVQRDVQITDFNAGEEQKKYALVVAVTDRKVIQGYESVRSVYSVPLTVSSEEFPIIIVSSPDENSTPTLSSNKFKITGYELYSTNNVSMAVAYLPKGNDQITVAQNLLKLSLNARTDSASGIRIWNLAMKDDGEYAGKYKRSFEQEFDVTEDFKSGGEIVNENKVFVFYAKVDDTGATEVNCSQKQFRLSAYTAAPEFKVEYNINGFDSESWGALGSVVNISSGQTIYVRAKAVGGNGIALAENGFSGKKQWSEDENASSIWSEGSSPNADGFYTFQFPESGGASMADGGRLDIVLSAKDILGNKAESRYSVEVIGKSTLKNVVSGVNSGITLTKGETMVVQAQFTGAVSGAAGSYIELEGIDGVSGGKPRAVYANGDGTDTLIYEWVVTEGAYTNDDVYIGTPACNASAEYPIQNATNITGSLTPALAIASIADESKVKVDAVSPKIKSYSPANGAVAKKNADGSLTVTLTFSEEVYAESGKITLERTEGWSIPPVIESEVFQQIYSKSSSANKKILMGSDNGVPLTWSNSRVACGPYMQTTHGLKKSSVGTKEGYVYEWGQDWEHGPQVSDDYNSFLKVSGGYYVPDLTTKYVLNFQYNISGDLGPSGTMPGGGTWPTTAQIRKALEDAGYHKAEYDITAASVDGNKVSLKITDEDFIDGFKDGVEWTLSLTAGAFRDAAGNVAEGIDKNSYKFVAGKVATPVIRVGRYTTDYKGGESEGGKVLEEPWESEKPAISGMVKVRIDCETKDASITYGVKEYDTERGNWDKSGEFNYRGHRYASDLTQSEGLPDPETSYAKTFELGEKSTMSADNALPPIGQKFYITAKASKTGYDDSEMGREGAFRTVIHYDNPANNKDNGKYGTIKDLKFFATDSPEGPPSLAGWPVMQNGYNTAEKYRTFVKVVDQVYALVSWELTCDFTIQTVANGTKVDYQFPADSHCTYGELLMTAHCRYY